MFFAFPGLASAEQNPCPLHFDKGRRKTLSRKHERGKTRKKPFSRFPGFVVKGRAEALAYERWFCPISRF
jgi:hypothetical protein